MTSLLPSPSSSSAGPDHAAAVCYNSDQNSNQQQLEQTEGRISFMGAKLFNAAAQGNIQVFNDYSDPLDLLLTPNKRTILHIHISSQTKSLGRIVGLKLLGLRICYHGFKISPPPATRSAAFVIYILRRCPSLLDKANAKRETPLHIAARYGRDDIVQLLIDFANRMRSQDPESHGVVKEMLRMTTVDEDTALHEAVRSNHKVVVSLLTIQDPELRYLGNNAGETPLYLAAERGYRDIVFAILETCNSPDCSGPNGRTALHAAVIINDKAMAAKILEKLGTHLAKRVDQQGWTPLHHAAYFGRVSIVELLLSTDKSAAYISSRDGMTPLHIAASKLSPTSCVQVMKTIISHCPECCEIADQQGWNFLHFAAARFNEKGLREILRNSIVSDLLNEKNVDGNTPFHLIVAHPMIHSALAVQPLLDLNAVNAQSKTAMDMILTSPDKKYINQKTALFRQIWRKGGKPIWRNEIPIPHESKRLDELANKVLPELRKAQESHLIVAILIATVTFAAAFTMPGGYNNSDSSTTTTHGPAAAQPGRAILSRNASFVAFLISDSLALLLSGLVVLIHFLLAITLDAWKFINLFLMAVGLNILAMLFMVVAFISATFAVLPQFLGTVICTTACFCLAAWLFIIRITIPFDIGITDWEAHLLRSVK